MIISVAGISRLTLLEWGVPWHSHPSSCHVSSNSVSRLGAGAEQLRGKGTRVRGQVAGIIRVRGWRWRHSEFSSICANSGLSLGVMIFCASVIRDQEQSDPIVPTWHLWLCHPHHSIRSGPCDKLLSAIIVPVGPRTLMGPCPDLPPAGRAEWEFP